MWGLTCEPVNAYAQNVFQDVLERMQLFLGTRRFLDQLHLPETTLEMMLTKRGKT